MEMDITIFDLFSVKCRRLYSCRSTVEKEGGRVLVSCPRVRVHFILQILTRLNMKIGASLKIKT